MNSLFCLCITIPVQLEWIPEVNNIVSPQRKVKINKSSFSLVHSRTVRERWKVTQWGALQVMRLWRVQSRVTTASSSILVWRLLNNGEGKQYSPGQLTFQPSACWLGFSGPTKRFESLNNANQVYIHRPVHTKFSAQLVFVLNNN